MEWAWGSGRVGVRVKMAGHRHGDWQVGRDCGCWRVLGSGV